MAGQNGQSANATASRPGMAMGDHAAASQITAAATPSKRLRILCVTPLGPEGRGGIDRLYRYVRELPHSAGIEVRYVVSRGQAPGSLWPLAFPWHLARLVWVLLAWRPHAVHINYANGGSLLRKSVIVWIVRLLHVPVVLHLHCLFPAAGARRGTVAGRTAVWLARKASHVIAIGHRAERDFIDVARLDASRVHVIANGAPDIGEGITLPKRHATLSILFAGEIGPRKGATILVEALARLRERPDWTCTIAGNGDVEGCRALIQARGLGDRVRLTGWIAASAVHGLMRDADIVVLPSLREVMPMSLVEATAAGAALLATPVGETADVVFHGVNGFLIDRDPADVTARLTQLLDDRDLLLRMQVASRDIYRQAFRLEAFVERLAAVYAAAASAAARLETGRAAGPSPSMQAASSGSAEGRR